MDRPSEKMRMAISGELPLSEAPQEALSFWVYRTASDVLSHPDKGARREALGRVPLSVRAIVEKEARRLWNKKQTT